MVRFGGDKAKADAVYQGVDPLTPDDIAEVVVFAAGRKENVVIADLLVYPNHQVSAPHKLSITCAYKTRRLRQSCTDDRERIDKGRYSYSLNVCCT